MDIQFVGLPSREVAQTKSRGRDANGSPIEIHLANGDAYPCRHCLGETPAGEEYMILAWRPFETSNPYAETGPIFLCAADCEAMVPSENVPPILVSPRYLVRGYSKEERIVYGTGQVVQTPKIAEYARELLANPTIAFVDVRSASNNCFQCRIKRA